MSVGTTRELRDKFEINVLEILCLALRSLPEHAAADNVRRLGVFMFLWISASALNYTFDCEIVQRNAE